MLRDLPDFLTRSMAEKSLNHAEVTKASSFSTLSQSPIKPKTKFSISISINFALFCKSFKVKTAHYSATEKGNDFEINMF